MLAVGFEFDLALLAGLEFAAYLLFGSFELFLGRWTIALLAASLVAALETRLQLLAVSILFLVLPAVGGLGRVIVYAALLFHLILITVFVFIEPFLELLLFRPLVVPQPILVDQTLDFTGSEGIVCGHPISASMLTAIPTFFF